MVCNQRAGSIVVCAPEISPSEPLISVVPFSSSRRRIRAEALELEHFHADRNFPDSHLQQDVTHTSLLC
jgi:hypothetical protein